MDRFRATSGCSESDISGPLRFLNSTHHSSPLRTEGSVEKVDPRHFGKSPYEALTEGFLSPRGLVRRQSIFDRVPETETTVLYDRFPSDAASPANRGTGKPREHRGTEHFTDEAQDTRLRVPVELARFPVLIALLRPAQTHRLSPISQISTDGELLGRIFSPR